MRKGFKLTLVTAALLVANQWLLGQQGWSRYRETTFAAITAESGYLLEGDYSVVSRDYPIKIKVGYTGEVRDIDADKKHLIEMWVKAFAVNPQVAERFQKELLFVENGVPYWLPVQSDLIPAFQQELKGGDCIWLFAQLWGGAQKKLVFVVNEFQAIPDTKCHG